MDTRVQFVAMLAAAALLLVVLELVRQRRLMERYALLWLFSGVVLLGLAIFSDVLETIAGGLGIATPVNALFFVAFGFVALLLLHFSTAVSRLADQNKVLAQQLALAEERLRRAEESLPPAVEEPSADPVLAER